MRACGEMILGLAMFGIYFLAWPIAAYISARKVRRRSASDASRFALVVGALSVLIGSILSTMTMPLRKEHHNLIVVIVIGWIVLPFVLVGIEAVALNFSKKRS